MHKALAVVVSLLSLSSVAPARAAERRSVAVSGSLSAGANEFQSAASGESKGYSLAATPAVDWLFESGLTLGVGAEVRWDRNDLKPPPGFAAINSSTTFVVPGAQVGYWMPLGEHAAFWPTARVSYGTGWVRTEATDGAVVDPRARIFAASLTPSFLILPTRSVFLRFSPGAFSYRSTKWEGFAATGSVLGVTTSFTMGVGVLL